MAMKSSYTTRRDMIKFPEELQKLCHRTDIFDGLRLAFADGAGSCLRARPRIGVE